MSSHDRSTRKTIETNEKGKVLTYALIKSSEWLGVNSTNLSLIVGFSDSTISRMKNDNFYIQEKSKEYEISAYFIRVYRSLFSIVGGDQATARAWLINENKALQGIPLELMKNLRGLYEVCEYLDTRRAII